MNVGHVVLVTLYYCLVFVAECRSYSISQLHSSFGFVVCLDVILMSSVYDMT